MSPVTVMITVVVPSESTIQSKRHRLVSSSGNPLLSKPSQNGLCLGQVTLLYAVLNITACVSSSEHLLSSHDIDKPFDAMERANSWMPKGLPLRCHAQDSLSHHGEVQPSHVILLSALTLSEAARNGDMQGVAGVITRQAPDVLCHAAVRARNSGVLLAACHQQAELVHIKSLCGQNVVVQLTQVSLDL